MLLIQPLDSTGPLPQSTYHEKESWEEGAGRGEKSRRDSHTKVGSLQVRELIFMHVFLLNLVECVLNVTGTGQYFCELPSGQQVVINVSELSLALSLPVVRLIQQLTQPEVRYRCSICVGRGCRSLITCKRSHIGCVAILFSVVCLLPWSVSVAGYPRQQWPASELLPSGAGLIQRVFIECI